MSSLRRSAGPAGKCFRVALPLGSLGAFSVGKGYPGQATIGFWITHAFGSLTNFSPGPGGEQAIDDAFLGERETRTKRGGP